MSPHGSPPLRVVVAPWGAAGLAVCDGRSAVPLDVAEPGHFPHFMDTIAPRLAALLAFLEEEAAETAEAPADGRGNESFGRRGRRSLGLAAERSRLLLVLPRAATGPGGAAPLSPETVELLAALGVATSLAAEDDVRCFRRVFDLCRVTGFDAPTLRRTQQILRATFAAPPPSLPAAAAAVAVASSPLQSPCHGGVYAARFSGARNGRRVVNEAAVAARLAAAPLRLAVVDGGRRLGDWAAALRHACALVGPHGGALARLFWLPPAATPADAPRSHAPVVVELDGHNRYGVFWALAAALGLRTAWLPYRPEAVNPRWRLVPPPTGAVAPGTPTAGVHVTALVRLLGHLLGETSGD